MENVMDEMLELYYWWNTVYLKEYPKITDCFWEVAGKCGPKMRFVTIEDRPHLSELVTEYRDDEQRDAYKAVIKNIRETEEIMDQKAEEMLCRLAAVRLWMWT
jgi:hypothetical protein